MNKIISYCLKNSFKINVISLFIVVIGLWSAFQLDIVFLPQTDHPNFFFSVKHSELGVYELDNQIAAPLSDQLLTIEGVKSLTTKVRAKRSTYWMKLDPKKDLDELEDEIINLTSAYSSQLPNGREDIVLGNPWAGFELGYLSVSGIDYNNDEHRFWLKSTLTKISKLEGVKSIERDLKEKNIYIDLNQEVIEKFELRIDEIKRILSNKFSAKSLGYTQTNSKRVKISFPQLLQSLDDIRNIVVFNKDSETLLFKDIADISYQRNPNPRKKSYYNSSEFSLYRIEGGDKLNVLNIIDSLKSEIELIQKKAPGNIKVDLLYESDGLIRKQLKLLKNNALIGLVLLIVLLGLLVGFRISLVVVWGLPIVYCFTFILMKYFNVQIDLMSVTGLIIVVGILVDDAMIVSEKYLDELESGKNSQEAIKQTIKRTLFPITGAMLTTIIAFYPIAYDDTGNRGWFWGVFMIMTLSLIASWFETYFILPNHLVHLIPKRRESIRETILNKVRASYEKGLRLIIKLRYLLLIGFIGFAFWTFKATFAEKSLSFNISINYPRIVMLVDFKEANDFDKSFELLKPFRDLIDKEVQDEMVGEYFIRLGSKRLNNTTIEGKEYGAIRMVIDPQVDNPKEKLQEVKKRLKDLWVSQQKCREFSGIKNIEFRDDLSQAQSSENEIKLNLRGIEEKKLGSLMDRLKKQFSKIKGIDDVFVPSSLFSETWFFEPNLLAMSEYGISFNQIQRELSPYLSFERVHQSYFKGERTLVYLGVNTPHENDMSQKDHYFVRSQDDLKVPLENLGTWKLKRTIKEIRRQDGVEKREISILFNSKLTNRESLSKELKKELLDIKKDYPKSYMWFDLESDERKKSKEWIFNSFIICLIGIYFVLIMTLKSLFQPALVMLAIPFGLVGIAWAIELHGYSWEMLGMIGIIGMTGVVVNDSLLMIDSINYEREKEVSDFTHAIVRGASSRLRPIVVTTLTTLAGIFPTVYGLGGDAGYTKILVFCLGWGIFAATFLILTLLPAFVKIIDDLSFFRKN